jgi:hypothetical protein
VPELSEGVYDKGRQLPLGLLSDCLQAIINATKKPSIAIMRGAEQAFIKKVEISKRKDSIKNWE